MKINFDAEINRLEWELQYKKMLLNSTYGSIFGNNSYSKSKNSVYNVYNDVSMIRNKISRLKKLKIIFDE